MVPFTSLTGPAASLAEADIDTDVIFPARFLLLLDRAGLGRHLFQERRFESSGAPKPDFVLNRPPFDAARVLIADRNFGSGSSREQAVWALADFGIRCVIAASFGEIFFNNCFKNGVLPIVLDLAALAGLRAATATGADLTVDLDHQHILMPDGTAVNFSVDPHRRAALLAGLDEIGKVLAEDGEAVERFEAAHRARAPWLFLDAVQLAPLADLMEGNDL